MLPRFFRLREIIKKQEKISGNNQCTWDIGRSNEILR
jgi:hypothetical protein